MSLHMCVSCIYQLYNKKSKQNSGKSFCTRSPIFIFHTVTQIGIPLTTWKNFQSGKRKKQFLVSFFPGRSSHFHKGRGNRLENIEEIIVPSGKTYINKQIKHMLPQLGERSGLIQILSGRSCNSFLKRLISKSGFFVFENQDMQDFLKTSSEKNIFPKDIS